MEQWTKAYTPLILEQWYRAALKFHPLATGTWVHLLERQASQVLKEVLDCPKLNTLVITRSMADQTLAATDILQTEDVIQQVYDHVRSGSELGSQIVNAFPVSLINAALWKMVDEAFQHAQVIQYLTVSSTNASYTVKGVTALSILIDYIAYLKELNTLVSWGMRVISWKTFRSTLQDLNHEETPDLDKVPKDPDVPKHIDTILFSWMQDKKVLGQMNTMVSSWMNRLIHDDDDDDDEEDKKTPADVPELKPVEAASVFDAPPHDVTQAPALPVGPVSVVDAPEILFTAPMAQVKNTDGTTFNIPYPFKTSSVWNVDDLKNPR
jgi:hypothetical protein